jgi:SAM-dependent methyltransferase
MLSTADQVYYDNHPSSVPPKHVAVVTRYFDVYQPLLSVHFKGSSIRALDLGAGSCTLSALLSRQEFVRSIACFDISIKKMQDMAPSSISLLEGLSEKLSFHQGDFASQLPFDAGSFDLIVFDGGLHHSRSMWATVEELRRLLAPSGLVVAQREQYLGYWTAKFLLKRLLQTPEVKAGVSENSYLKEQYEYYFRAGGFDIKFLPVAESALQTLLLPLNGLLFSKWVLMASLDPLP